MVKLTRKEVLFMLFSPEIKESPTLLLGEKARQKKKKVKKLFH